MLLESQGYDVKSTIIQALCRDPGLRIATERYITQPIYLIPINRISDHWLSRYLQAKTKRLQQALETGIVPSLCSAKENWHGRKCDGYCVISEQCKAFQQHQLQPEPSVAYMVLFIYHFTKGNYS